MSQEEMRAAARRLEGMVRQVESVDPSSTDGETLAATVNVVLAEIFGDGTPEYARASMPRAFDRTEALRNLNSEIDILRGRLGSQTSSASSGTGVEANGSAATVPAGPVAMQGVSARGIAASLAPEVPRGMGVAARGMAAGESPTTVALSARGSASVTGRTAPNVERVLAQPPFVQNNSIDVAAGIAARRPNNRAAIDASGGSMPLPLQASLTQTADLTLAELGTGWAHERPAILERITVIEEALRQLAPVIDALEAQQARHGEMGHNNPPEPLPIDGDEIQNGISAANVIRSELNEQQPHTEAVQLSWSVLRHVAKGVRALAGWLLGKGDKYCDAFAIEAGKATAKLIMGGMAGAALVTGGVAGVTLIAALERVGVNLTDLICDLQKLLHAGGLMH